jgi:hypothetical protein
MVCTAEQQSENSLLVFATGYLPSRRQPGGEPAADGWLTGTYGRNCWAILVTWPCCTVIQNGGVPEFGK